MVWVGKTVDTEILGKTPNNEGAPYGAGMWFFVFATLLNILSLLSNYIGTKHTAAPYV